MPGNNLLAVPSPLSFTKYQQLAVITDRTRSDVRSLTLPLLGLFGETGSLLSEAKKKHRDPTSYLGYERSVVEELGDVLWYLTILADRAQIELSDLAHSVRSNQEFRGGAGDLRNSFKSLGHVSAGSARPAPTPNYDKTLLRLAGRVGSLLTRFDAGDYNEGSVALSGDLVSVLSLLVLAADEANVTLEQAARQNLEKIFDRWPQVRTPPAHFDEGYPVEEQIPRVLEIEVFERSIGNRHYVFQRCRGINIGDRLTDNILTPDDYRFHDVFHYAFAAVLGWSPVLRALFRLKRKSQPSVDEGEDGARAALTEEGVATWVFGYAKQLDFFAGIKVGELPLDILKTVRRFVAGYEPEVCPLWLWEEAILQGYEAFRFLKEHRRGQLRLDLSQHRLFVKEMAQ